MRRIRSFLKWADINPLMLGVVLALLGWAGCERLVCAAPVPPPRKLTRELLLGWWDYEYGHYRDGQLCLNPDGTYFARHQADHSLATVGVWWIENQALVLREFGFCMERGLVGSGPAQYEFRLATDRYPYLIDDGPGRTRVVLSNPRFFEPKD
jgi:hypothetical protein